MLILALVSTEYVYKEFEQSSKTNHLEEKSGETLRLFPIYSKTKLDQTKLS